MMRIKQLHAETKLKAIGLVMGLSCILLTGCAIEGADSAIEPNPPTKSLLKDTEAIEAVILKEFGGTDVTYIELLEQMSAAQENVKTQEGFDAFKETAIYQDYHSYVTFTYASYFTENGFDFFINGTPAFKFSRLAGAGNLNVSDISFSQNEQNQTLYQFTFPVNHTDDDGQLKAYRFEGEAIVPTPGMIGKIEFIDLDGLYEVLNPLSE